MSAANISHLAGLIRDEAQILRRVAWDSGTRGVTESDAERASIDRLRSHLDAIEHEVSALLDEEDGAS
jgi:hypothetical protein